MNKMINFGIDLGTTNSAIAKFISGEVEIFQNPQEPNKFTIPSVVYYSNDKVIVGTNAKSYFDGDAANVFANFKRKMGTTESVKVPNLNLIKTPVELSAEVLKTLKRFVGDHEKLDAAIITIPASFDLIQANSTKEAGLLAGFKEVILLQEPIAASLAFANNLSNEQLPNGQWLVYDFGGGTFDVALIKIKDGDMKVIDHEGHNFLGGADFDNLIVEKVLVPSLNTKFQFNNLEQELKSKSGKYHHFYFKLLKLAEDAKIELSNRTMVEIELSGIHDDANQPIDIIVTLKREEFEELIDDAVALTITMIQDILTRNNSTTQDIQFALMVGGSTYIPYIRKRISESLSIPVKCEIDPTTAIAIGAAYFAGTRVRNTQIDSTPSTRIEKQLKLSYENITQDDQEILMGKFTGNYDGLYYQIIREDNGYDSGVKPLSAKFTAYLPLVINRYNTFKLTILDDKHNTVETDAEIIGITQGKYNVIGQPLPQDICIETDNQPNLEAHATKLDMYFQKNTILPQKRTKSYTLNKSILIGDKDKIIINVLEGSHMSLPAGNLSIGYIEIDGAKLTKSVIKGADIEISLDMNESRDLGVSIYFPMSDQTIYEAFKPTHKSISVEKIKDDLHELSNSIITEINNAIVLEQYEQASLFTDLESEIDQLIDEANNLSTDDSTDKKYQIDTAKRKIAQAINNLTKDKKMEQLNLHYQDLKKTCEQLVINSGNDNDVKLFYELVAQEKVFLNGISYLKLKDAIDEMETIEREINWRMPVYLKNLFSRLCAQSSQFNNPDFAKELMQTGSNAIESNDFNKLKEINITLLSLFPRRKMPFNYKYKIGF